FVHPQHERLTRRWMPRLDRFAPFAQHEPHRNHDKIRSAAPHRDARSVANRVLERVVAGDRELRHQLAPANHSLTKFDRTPVARSISPMSTYSSAECASPMSPGPKQIAGIPAA